MNHASKRHFWLGIVLGGSFLVVILSGVTGRAFHPEVGVLMTSLLVVHLILHRAWITATLRRAARLKGRARTNLRIAVGLTLTYTITIATGFAIMPGAHGGESPEPWTHLHAAAATLSLALTLWHLGLHWSWLRKGAPSHYSVARHA